MNEFEKRLTDIAKGMDYPPTPDIAGFVSTRLRPAKSPRLISRRLAWSLTIVLILLSSLLLIPPARAAILEFIQIGIVRIFPAPEETPATAEPESFVPTTATPAAFPPPTAKPFSQSAPLLVFLDQIAGETKLANAKEIAEYPILLPTYPKDWGQPNHVYVQDVDGVMTILVWVDAQQPERVTLSLHFIPAGSWAIHKFAPAIIEETSVDGNRAIWAVGPYPLRLIDGDLQVTRLISGRVLIWEKGGITYRLESDQPLDEAVKIAESLR